MFALLRVEKVGEIFYQRYGTTHLLDDNDAMKMNERTSARKFSKSRGEVQEVGCHLTVVFTKRYLDMVWERNGA